MKNEDEKTGKTEKVGEDPLINSAGYYQTRIHESINAYKELSVTGDIIPAYQVLLGLYMEIRPRIKSMKIKKNLDAHMNSQAEYTTYLDKSMPANVQSNLLNQNSRFFLKISDVAHKLGLIMPDKPKESNGMGL